MLPPSGHTKIENILAIGHAMFSNDSTEGWATDRSFLEVVFPASSSSTALFSPLDGDVTEIGGKTVELIVSSQTNLVSIIKEANVRQILGIFLIFLSTCANSRNIITNGSVRVDFEFTVWDTLQAERNPATDAAVVLVHTDAAKLQPLILYELKASVHPHGPNNSRGDLIELFIQCYYCINRYKLSYIIGCLTDTTTWHYFKIVTTTAMFKLSIEWTQLIKHADGSQLTTGDITKHWTFLFNVMRQVSTPDQ